MSFKKITFNLELIRNNWWLVALSMTSSLRIDLDQMTHWSQMWLNIPMLSFFVLLQYV